jgi:hypothetical protein
VKVTCYLCRRQRADKHMDGHRCTDHAECLRVAATRLPAQHRKLTPIRRPWWNQ